MYQSMQNSSSQQPQTTSSKLKRSIYLIISITLLNHTMSITYSLLSFKQQSAGFISIIISSLICFFLSSSHLTIYGISILGILYMKMLQPYYSRSQIHYIVALSGIIMFPFWKILKYVGRIFDSLPGRVHVSMVFGIALIALFKFFPLTIQNLHAFFQAGYSNILTNPWNLIVLTFKKFNILTLLITIACISALFLVRNKLTKIPFVAILVLIGIIINYKHIFLDYQDMCLYTGVDCKFYIVKLQNMYPPGIQKLILMLPSAAVMSVVLIFQQFLYLQQFQRRGKRYFGQGDLGQTQKQSKTLALANMVSGCMGGLPICINLFATYQNFSFNVRVGQSGTKLVGLMQIPVSYILYSLLKGVYQMIPLFILFVIVATPVIYFLSNMLRIYRGQLLFISCLAGLNVITHPVLALILAAFISIYDISLMLKSTPAQIVLQNVQDEQGSRKSSRISSQVVVQKKQQGQKQVVISQFAKRVIQIETDQPHINNTSDSYVLYRFTGAVSYLNYFEHMEQIKQLIQKYVKKQKIPLLLSFRYSQTIDEESLIQLAIYIQKLQSQENVRIIFTGLHRKLVSQMQKIKYFQQMLRKDQKCMYRLDHAD